MADLKDAPDLFKTAPAEVTRYFKEKGQTPSFDWRDVAPQEHAFAFTVAKSAGYDILDDIRSAVDQAIENRVPFEEFKAELTPILQSKGWWGRKKAVDPRTGETRLVQLGSPRRLRTIYWANTRTAHAAGEWERTQRNKAFLPLLEYRLSVAEHRRVEHEGWVGTILPVDDPWWDTHYPPNGWLCQCGVRQISRRDAERRGYKDGQAAPEDEFVPWHNKRTGETQKVPKGIDPGWDTNPGKLRGSNAGTFLTGKIEAMADERKRLAIADIVGSPVLKSMAQGHMPNNYYVPVAQVPAKVVTAFGAQSNTARLSAYSLDHIINHPKKRDITFETLQALPELIAYGTYFQNKPNHTVVVGIIAGGGWRAILKWVPDLEEWWVQSFHTRSPGRIATLLEKGREDWDRLN